MTSCIVQSISKSYSGFDPRSIPSCALWLDAADPNAFTFSSGSNISQWNDKSGNANHASAFAGTTTLSNQGVVFTGSQALNTPLSSLISNQTGFIILSHASGTGTLDVIAFRYSSGSPGIQAVIDTNVQKIREWGGATRVTGATLTQNTRLLYGYNYVSGGGAGTANLYNGGTLTGTSSATAPGFTGSGTIMIGGYADGGGPYERFVGTMNEIVLFNSILTTSQRQQMEGYLAQKWGLAANLPATHPLKSIPVFTRFFQPTDIDNCALWLDAADTNTLVLSSGKVAQWNDKSGNGYSVAQTNAARQPLLASSPPGITLQGGVVLTQTVGNVPLLRDATALTMLTVLKPTSATSDNLILSIWFNDVTPTGATTGKFILNLTNTNTVTAVLNATTGISSRTSTNTISTNSLGIAGAVLSSTASVDVNGTLTSSTAGTLSTASSDALFTVGYLNYNNFILHEVVFYNRELSTSERQQAEGYLAWKWGTRATLPTTQPFKLFRSPSVLFNPLAFSNCGGWFDAADTSSLTLSGSTVTQWRDKSGNSRHLNQNTGATFSNNSVVFTGTQSYGGANTGNLLRGVFFGIFVVERVNTGGYLLGDNVVNGNGASLATGYNSLTNVTMSFFFSDLNVTSISGSGATRIWSFILPSSGNRFINLNGSLAGTFTNNTQLTAFSSLRVGGVYGGNSYNGSLYEILIYVGGLTRGQIQQIEGHLAWKWGIQTNLPVTHPYYNTRA